MDCSACGHPNRETAWFCEYCWEKFCAKNLYFAGDGALARPDDLRFTDALPKTRSGTIMRRLLRDIAAGRESVGDTTTLEDYSVLARLREEEE